MKKSYILNTILVVSVLIFCVIRVDGLIRERREVDGIAEKIIRFHVLANSDSKEDQELKLKVRDAVGLSMQERFAQVQSYEQGREVIDDNIDFIVDTAKEVIKEEGYSYNVSASLKTTEFPVKTYGSFTFPAGEYEALQVVIGDGDGANWWCVMYPNLCFYDNTYEVVDDEAKEVLKKALTSGEYASLMEDKNYEIKFKWLSFFN